MTRWNKGFKKEHELMMFFEFYNFMAMRSAGSHGAWDVMATPPIFQRIKDTIHIQCGPHTKDELAELKKIADAHCGVGAHVLFKDREEPIIKVFPHDRYITITQFLLDHYGIPPRADYFTTIKTMKKYYRLLKAFRKAEKRKDTNESQRVKSILTDLIEGSSGKGMR